jgi:hypothetical protein
MGAVRNKNETNLPAIEFQGTKDRSWRYNDFVVRLPELLVALRQRDRVKLMTTPPQGFDAKASS